MKFLSIGLFLFMPCISHAQCNLKKTLYFANGMFNDRAGATDSLNRLKQELGRQHLTDKYESINLAFNTNEPALIQLYQVYRQKIKDVDVKFWKSFGLLIQLDKKTVDNILSKYMSVEKNLDADLSLQIKNYQSDLDKGMRIITVAHSQGNFYTNFAFDFLNAHAATSMISVATPASSVYEDGPYFTFKSDGIVGNIPTALRPNLVRDPAGFFDHEFIKHYLGEVSANEKILEAVHHAYQMDNSSEPSLNPFNGYFNNDFNPVLSYYEKLKAQKNIQPGQCVLVKGLYMVYGTWNDTYRNRSFKTLKNKISDCIEEYTNPNPEAHATGCPLETGHRRQASGF